MRGFRGFRDVLVCLACVCVLLLTAEAIYIQARLGSVLSQLNQSGDPGVTVEPDVTVPDPDDTACPAGPNQCD